MKLKHMNMCSIMSETISKRFQMGLNHGNISHNKKEFFIMIIIVVLNESGGNFVKGGVVCLNLSIAPTSI